MKKEKHSLTDWYYIILKESIENKDIKLHELYEKLGLPQSCSYCYNMEELAFIEVLRNYANQIRVTPHGLATFLSLSSQKQASEQALKATKLANYALWISIASFVASIVFSILQIVLK